MATHAHPHGAHSHGHHHHHAPAGLGLSIAFACTAALAILEFAGGLYSRSLALLADSGHVLVDAVALGIAVFAARQALRPANSRRTFGYARVEILAALGNGALLFAIAIVIAVEAARRFGSPGVPEGGIMLGVAGIGLITNIVLGLSLMHGARENLNTKAALYHIASDAAGAVAVAIAGGLVLLTRLPWIDPAISLVVAVIVGAGVWRIVREAGDVLLESAPAHVSTRAVRDRMRTLEGVVDVHDLHIWTIGTQNHALSAHVLLRDARISEASAILRAVDALLREEFDIGHVTVQFECESCGEDDRIVCTQVPTG